ncbi:unnamed protein product [Brugia timori]|uniref:DUF1897 domain-containing protein n=1 Tax=Brugia timori TaxID=42155 RepID=A0A0R3RAY3_9BILA|nr:unnamed protein product [Brugia timori]
MEVSPNCNNFSKHLCDNAFDLCYLIHLLLISFINFKIFMKIMKENTKDIFRYFAEVCSKYLKILRCAFHYIHYFSGQPDYSAQWAEYYRSMGMHEQAAVIENQLKQNAAAAAAAAAAAQQPAAQARPQQPGYGAYGAQPITAQNQFSYGTPQAQPQGGYQFQQQY